MLVPERRREPVPRTIESPRERSRPAFGPGSLLAFVHIEKAAGTTLNRVLRRNFFLRHMDVRPLSRDANKLFRAEDLRIVLRVNPWIRSISGHSVTASTDLSSVVPDVRYITLLREPARRYVSHYIYSKDRTQKHRDFEEFLAKNVYSNFQVRALTGPKFAKPGRVVTEADLHAARESLLKRFWLVGIVEEFDAFMLQLKQKLEPMAFNPAYRRRNVSAQRPGVNAGEAQRIHEQYRDAIAENNALDEQLYRYARDTLLPAQKAAYGPRFVDEVAALRAARRPGEAHPVRASVDFVARKTYYDPALGLVRRLNGLPYRGTY